MRVRVRVTVRVTVRVRVRVDAFVPRTLVQPVRVGLHTYTFEGEG